MKKILLSLEKMDRLDINLLTTVLTIGMTVLYISIFKMDMGINLLWIFVPMFIFITLASIRWSLIFTPPPSGKE